VKMARLMSDQLEGLPSLKHRFGIVRMYLAHEWEPLSVEASEILSMAGRPEAQRWRVLRFQKNSALWPELAALYGVKNALVYGSFGVYLVGLATPSTQLRTMPTHAYDSAVGTLARFWPVLLSAPPAAKPLRLRHGRRAATAPRGDRAASLSGWPPPSSRRCRTGERGRPSTLRCRLPGSGRLGSRSECRRTAAPWGQSEGRRDHPGPPAPLQIAGRGA
jgi:hypothetical protein